MDCAIERLRFIMSEGRVTQSAATRKFTRGDRVFVNGEIQQPGIVVRVDRHGRGAVGARDRQYTVKLDTGMRCYVYADDMRDLPAT